VLPTRVLCASNRIPSTPLSLSRRGRGLLSQVASAFGITATIDDSVVSRQVRFDIQNVEFFTVCGQPARVTHTFWTPLEEKQS